MVQDDISTRRADYFWARVNKTEDCWLWTGITRPRGYGIIKLPKKDGKQASTIGAHRFSYLLHFGHLPADQNVCHHCDNPPCVRPDHLFLGTGADNARDMLSKGRHGSVSSPDRFRMGAKLTDAQVIEIRRQHALGLATPRQLAQRFGVHSRTIREVMAGITWKHLLPAS